MPEVAKRPKDCCALASDGLTPTPDPVCVDVRVDPFLQKQGDGKPLIYIWGHTDHIPNDLSVLVQA